jgi:hypothetical protein
VSLSRARGGADALGWAVLALAAAGGLWAAVSRGLWLDEFWSLDLGSRPLGAETWRLWLTDPHPPLANLLYHAALTLTGGNIMAARVALNLPPLLAFLAATVWFEAKGRTRGFYLPFAVLALSVPGFALSFSELRSYAWQICAAAIVVQLCFFLATEPPSDRDRPALAIGAAAIPFALATHYVAALTMSFVLASLLLHLLSAGERHRAAIVGIVAGAAWAGMAAIAIVQVPATARAFDYRWIGTSTTDAALHFARAVWQLGVANPVGVWAAAAALVAWLVPRAANRPPQAAGERAIHPSGRFLRIVAPAAIAAALLLIALNRLQPLIVARYLNAWQFLAGGVFAAIAAPWIAGKTWHAAIFYLCGLFAIATGSARAAGIEGWSADAHRIAARVRDCPSTRVYAVTPWRLSPGRGTRTAAREEQVFALGYRRLAADAGFAFTLPKEQAVLPLDPACPTLVWLEHGRPRIPPARLLYGLGLRPSGAARVRFESASSGILIVEPLAPAGARR